ncbi:Pheophorbide a oxygenase family [Synechococcus sp. PCC 7335]|nr:Pheophorbide a oxygenase family [Synechococcus sp. PCC 7335]
MDKLDVRPTQAKVESPSYDESALVRDSSPEESFQWTQQWYPLAVADYLDPQRPHAMQLLGKDVVLWRDGTGTWRCFENACPHRLAPLSEGRIEADGRLLCAYHAWRFDGSGKCDRIPQSKDLKTEAKYCNDPRSAVAAYPTQERQGLIWVWGDSSAAAQQASQQRAPRTVPELDSDSNRVVRASWNFRDLAYGWDFFMENVSDPAHVPVSHHGLVGDRYTGPKFYDMPQLREVTTQGGFAYSVTPTPDTISTVTHDFQPPCLMRISTEFEGSAQLILVLYATPTLPGQCRHIGQQILVKDSTGKTPKGLAFFGLPMPTWLSHILASLFLHQDMVFLHYQEQIVAQRESQRKSWIREVYTPNPQDKMVIAFRQWLAKRAGGGVPWPASSTLPPVDVNKERVFDVWHTHTKNCQVCQTARSRIGWVRRIAYGAAIFLFGIALMVDARTTALQAALDPTVASRWPMPPTEFWIALVLAGLLMALGYGLQRLQRLFYRYEFEHFKNN